MRKYGLRARVFFLTLAPTLIISMLLSFYFISSRYQELEQQVSQTGQAIIEPLAIASEIGLSNENRESVRRLIEYTHRQHSQYIRTIVVFSKQNNLFVTSNFHHDLSLLTLAENEDIPKKFEIRHLQNSLLLFSPIRAVGGFNGNLNHDAPIGYIAMEMDLSKVKLEKYQEAISAGVALILAMILSIIFAYRLLHDVETPIKQMISMIDKIRRGHLDVRIEGKLFGELDSLKNGINAMAISLSQYHSEMQQSIDQATSDLLETLEQLEIQNIELDIAKKNAQEAVKIKSEFIANMSHELRTPLNSVLGFTRQMLKTPLSKNQQDYLKIIENSAKNLLSIINDILDFSKLEAGKLLLEHISFDLEETLDNVIRQLALMAHEKGIELNLNIDPQAPNHLIGDPQRLQQVLINLIGNAIKFTEHGFIHVKVEQKNQKDKNVTLLFVVTDTGIGISECQQTQLFQAFSQADASISRRYGGTGLGLVITQKLIHEMGGTISLNSRLHQGSAFWFTLPLLQVDTIKLDNATLKSVITGPLILIEQDDDIREMKVSSLKHHGLNVFDFAQLPYQHSFCHAVIICINANNVPHLNTLIEQIQCAKQYTHNVIFCLPTTEISLSDQLLSAGASACLAKPLNITKLISLLQEKPETPYHTHLLPSAPKQKRTATVLALDDNPANLKLIRTLLQERVSHVITAIHGKKAVIYANQQAFDLIFMDIQMPELDGISACKEIRKTTLNATTPIIAVTAHAIEGERERLLSEGMNDYLTKPIDEYMLESVITRWLQVHKKTPPAIAAPEVFICEKLSEIKNSIDWPLAIKQAAGKEHLAKEMLDMLVFSFEDIEININKALEGEPIDLYAIIHKLHGSCAYSGVPKLQKLCYQIESMLLKNALIVDVEPELFELLDEIEKVKDQSNDILSSHFFKKNDPELNMRNI